MDISRLIWDAWNIAHIARHAVDPLEVEEVCRNQHLAMAAKQDRIMLIGRTDAGRVLAVVLAREANDDYYTITARPADRKERRIFAQHAETE